MGVEHSRAQVIVTGIVLVLLIVIKAFIAWVVVEHDALQRTSGVDRVVGQHSFSGLSNCSWNTDAVLHRSRPLIGYLFH